MRRQPVAVEVYMDVTFTRFDEAEHIVVILMRIVDRVMLYAVCWKYTKVYGINVKTWGVNSINIIFAYKNKNKI